MSSLESALTVRPPGARITAQSEAPVPSPIRALTVFKNTSTCTEPPAPTLLVLPAAPPLASRLCGIFCSYIHSAGESIISCSHFCYGLTLNYIHCRAYCYCHAICSCCCCAVLRSQLRWFSLASALTVRFLAVMFAALYRSLDSVFALITTTLDRSTYTMAAACSQSAYYTSIAQLGS